MLTSYRRYISQLVSYAPQIVPFWYNQTPLRKTWVNQLPRISQHNDELFQKLFTLFAEYLGIKIGAIAESG